MFEITRQLSYSDIEMLNRNKNKKEELEKEENNIEQEEKYRDY